MRRTPGPWRVSGSLIIGGENGQTVIARVTRFYPIEQWTSPADWAREAPPEQEAQENELAIAALPDLEERAERYEAALRKIIADAPPFEPESRVYSDMDEEVACECRMQQWETAVLAYDALGLPLPQAPIYAQGDRVHQRMGAGLDLDTISLSTGEVVEIDNEAESGAVFVAWYSRRRAVKVEILEERLKSKDRETGIHHSLKKGDQVTLSGPCAERWCQQGWAKQLAEDWIVVSDEPCQHYAEDLIHCSPACPCGGWVEPEVKG